MSVGGFIHFLILRFLFFFFSDPQQKLRLPKKLISANSFRIPTKFHHHRIVPMKVQQYQV